MNQDAYANNDHTEGECVSVFVCVMVVVVVVHLPVFGSGHPSKSSRPKEQTLAS